MTIKSTSKRAHPLHMMIVHFPSALYPFSLLMELIGWYYQDAIYGTLALFTLAGGVAGAILAIISGSFELVKIAPNSKSWNIAIWHGGLNVFWLMIFGVLLAIRFREYPNVSIARNWYLVTMFGATIGLFASNYLGGELVVNYGIGTNQQNR